MTNYSKGAKGENEIGELFAEEGYVWMRAPGSGTGNRCLPDVILGKNGHTIVLEVKRADGDEKYIYLQKTEEKDEVGDLMHFAEEFGADYYIAYRFDRGRWHFVLREEMKKNEKSYRCKRDLSERSLSDICK